MRLYVYFASGLTAVALLGGIVGYEIGASGTTEAVTESAPTETPRVIVQDVNIPRGYYLGLVSEAGVLPDCTIVTKWLKSIVYDEAGAIKPDGLRNAVNTEWTAIDCLE